MGMRLSKFYPHQFSSLIVNIYTKSSVTSLCVRKVSDTIKVGAGRAAQWPQLREKVKNRSK